MQRVRSKDGTAIAFDRSGKGPTVILIGGALQYRAIDPRTAQLAALLAPHFTVFHYDRRGRGDSEDTPPYATEREIEDLETLVAEGGGAAFVFGMSSGAVLALDTAAHGLAIAKLALYEPPFVVDSSRPPLPDNYVTHLNELVSSGQRGDAVEYFMTKAADVPEEFVAPMRNEPFWQAFEVVAHTLAYDGAFMADTVRGQPLPTKRWATVKLPTLIMDGGASPAWIHSGAQALADILPNAQRRTLADQTHDVAPEILAPVLEEFFRG